jgi:hypothetical protein
MSFVGEKGKLESAGFSRLLVGCGVQRVGDELHAKAEVLE